MIDKYGALRCDGCGKKFGELKPDGLAIVCQRDKRYNFFKFTDLRGQYYSHQVVALENRQVKSMI